MLADYGDDDEFDEAIAAVWRAANAANLTPEQHKELQELLRELRGVRGELVDLTEANERFTGTLTSSLSDRLVPGLINLGKELGRTPNSEEIQEYLHNSVREAQAIAMQPLKAMTPSMTSETSELAEFPDALYLALGRLVVRFGQVEEAVSSILYYLRDALGLNTDDSYTGDLNDRRNALREVSIEAREKEFLSQKHGERLKSFLDKTKPLARERSRYIHAGYILPKDSPSKYGLIRRGDKKKPDIISLQSIDLDEVTGLVYRIKGAAQEGWDLYYAILDSNQIGPNK